jgi:hypothetical protein
MREGVDFIDSLSKMKNERLQGVSERQFPLILFLLKMAGKLRKRLHNWVQIHPGRQRRVVLRAAN